jgi:hypothetical protein
LSAVDFKHLPWKSKDYIPWDMKLLRNGTSTIEIHHNDRFGWCIATLPISKDRSYGISIDNGEVVSMGVRDLGKERRIILRKSRLGKLQKFIDLFNTGYERAQDIRDRTSTRRAQTVARRAGMAGLWL